MTIKRVQRGRNHSYTIDGKKAIGVTTALGKAWPQPWMGPWTAKVIAQTAVDMSVEEWDALLVKGRDTAINTLKGAANKQRDTAATRGTDVHNIAEKVIHGDEVAVPEHLTGHVESVVRFMDDWQVRPLLVEKVVGSYRYGYAGTFDLIAELPDGQRVLFDYKTAGSIRDKDALQLAAYRYADYYVAGEGLEMPMTEIGIDCCKAVHVRADGYDVIPLQADEETFNLFLNVLWVARAYEHAEDLLGPAEAKPSWAVPA